MPVVIVTGASSGIGRATAARLGRAGHTVVLAARRADELATLAAEISAAGGKAVAVPTDVRDPDAITSLVARAVAVTGRLDGLVNNAGIGGSASIMADDELVTQMIEVNLLAPIRLMRAVVPIMRQQGRRGASGDHGDAGGDLGGTAGDHGDLGGSAGDHGDHGGAGGDHGDHGGAGGDHGDHGGAGGDHGGAEPRRAGAIVNIGSVAGEVGIGGTYSATKFALRGMTDSVRRELAGTGIGVTLIEPGFIATAAGSERRGLPGPEIVAAAVQRALHRPRRRIVVPVRYRAAIALSNALPFVTDRVYASRRDPRGRP
jgi:NAD(P)-dependent dehydrogenase (short-subunit alcohol dehydrogenase family)